MVFSRRLEPRVGEVRRDVSLPPGIAALTAVAEQPPRSIIRILFRPTRYAAKTPFYLLGATLAFASAEQGFALEQASPITPTAWISISIPGRAKFVTVMSALPG